MSDTAGLQETCEAIGAILSEAEADRAKVIELAGRYSAYARLANVRIRRASDWISKGLRSEAVQHVEVAPNVMEIASALELGFEKRRWQQLCWDCGINDLESVSVDLAREINGAYVKHLELEPQLTKYRLLCIAGSTVADRMRALIPIAKADPENNSWREQLIDLEKARLHEILRETSAAAARNEVAKLQELLAEVSKPGWITEPPSPLRRKLQDEVRRLKAKHDSSRFADLALQLQQGLAAMDSAGVRTAVRDWEAVAAAGQARPSDDEMAVMDQARAWLAAQDANLRRQEANAQMLAEFEKAIEDRAPYVELERLHDRLVQADASLNQTLLRRYNTYVSECKQERKHRQQLKTIVAVGVLLLAAAGLAWKAIDASREQEITSKLAMLDQAASSTNINDLKRLLEKEIDGWNERVLADSRIQSKIAVIRARIADDDSRARRFAGFITEIKAASGTDEHVWSVLVDAEKLALSPDDRATLAEQRRRLERGKQNAQAEIDDPFETQSDELFKKFRLLDREDPKLRDELKKILDQFDRLFLVHPQVSTAVRKRGQDNRNAVDRELNELLAKDRNDRNERELLAKIPAPASSVQEFLKRLKTYRDEFPDYAPAKKFENTLELEKDLAHIDSLARTIVSWGKTLHVATQDEAAKRLKLLEDASGFLPKDAVSRYSEYLRKVIDADADARDQRIKEMRAQLEDAWRRDLQWIANIDGVRYYTRNGQVEPATEGHVHLTRRLASIQDLIEPDRKLNKALFVPAKGAKLQPVFAGYVKAVEADLTKHDQDKLSIELLYLRFAKAAADQLDIDPIPRLASIKRDLEAYTQVAWPVSASVQTFLKDIKGLTALDTNVDWINVEDANVKAARVEAQAALAKCPDLAKVESDAVEEIAALARSLAPPLLAGLVWDAEDGKELTVRTWQQQGTALVAKRTPTGLTFVPVAEVDAKSANVKWLGDDRPQLGTPVFVRARQ